MRKIALAAVMLAGISATAYAADSVISMATFNDGFIYVVLAGAASDELLPRFCPHHKESWGSTCFDDKGDTEQPIPAQKILDMRFGPGKATAVGLAPVTSQNSVVYYRINKDTK